MKKILIKKTSKKICKFLNTLAYITRSSYSFAGPYSPQKPAKLLKKDTK